MIREAILYSGSPSLLIIVSKITLICSYGLAVINSNRVLVTLNFVVVKVS